MVVVVARDDQHLGLPGGFGERGEERRRQRQCVGQRPVAQLDHVAEQDHAVGARGRLEQRPAKALVAQQVAVGAGAEVEVGGDQGSHSRDPRSRSRIHSPRGERHAGCSDFGLQPRHGRDARDGARAGPGGGGADGRHGPGGSAGLGGAWLRGPSRDPVGSPHLAGRQRRARRGDDLRRDRPPRRRDPVRRALLRPLGAGVLGEAGLGVPRRRGDRVGLAVRPRPQARRPLRPDRRRRRDRTLELPVEQLLRRLHSGARGRQRRRPQALRGDPADLAADGRDAGRLGHRRRRLPGRHRHAARPGPRSSTRSTS